MKPIFRALQKWTLLSLALSPIVLPIQTLEATSYQDQITGRESVFVGHYDADDGFLWLHEANNLIGTSALYNMGYWGLDARIANVEGGIAWEGHEVFRQRQEGVPISIGPGITVVYTPNTFNHNSSVPFEPETAPAAGSYSAHATAVAAMLGGLTMGDSGELLILGTGIAPLAELQSGGIAISYDPEDPGAFIINKESFLTPYLEYFTGNGGTRPKMDVINSSWGYSDATGREFIYGGIIDGLANENPDVAMVAAAGNSGAGTQPGGPANGFNTISVGAVTQNGVQTDRYLQPADFTPNQPLDFHNPSNGDIVLGARAGIHVVAPGTDLVLAAYDETQPDADDLYYINAAGTSFAAPMVSGGIGLLKEMAKDRLSTHPEALDTRVVRSILMAGATATSGWNNGQTVEGDGVIRTHQSLDYQMGAGLVNLEKSAAIYLNPQTDEQTNVTFQGWDLNTIAIGEQIDYALEWVNTPVQLTLSLNWFVNTVYLEETQLSEDLWFSNLDLSVWLVEDSSSTLVAESISFYNNSEFLRLTLDGDAQYAIRVTHSGMIYDMTNAAGNEIYALAWSMQAIPEPSTWLLLLTVSAGAFILRRRKG